MQANKKHIRNTKKHLCPNKFFMEGVHVPVNVNNSWVTLPSH